MSSTAQHSPAPPTPIPLTQNTAPVIEFRCLFTPDLRRKQKRWQDGRLKFHTFNKRVMVYDEKLNFVGDTHWHDNELDEGEELELERAGVLVQVAECLGKKDQDLSELLDKRMKEKGERAASARIRASPAPSGASFSPVPSARQSRAFSALPQKSLSALLGTPSGHHGRALLPRTSPFEDRQNTLVKEKGDQEKPSKRRKVDSPYTKAGYAQNLTGVALDLSSTPRSTAALRREPLWTRTSRRQEGHGSAEIDHNVQNLRPNEKLAPSNDVQEQPRQTQRLRLASEKEAKSGYAQNLTGAVLDLSSTQKSNTFLRRQPLPARRLEKETSLKSHSGGGEREQSLREEPVQSSILQPLVESPSTRPLASKRDANVPGQRTEKLVKAGTERPPAYTAKARKEISARPNAKGQEPSPIIIASDDDSSDIGDDFIDIDALEQALPVPKSPVFNKTRDGPHSNRDVYVPSTVQSSGKSPPGVSRMQKDNLPVQTSESTQEAARRPAEPVSVIRLKSRPKRRMLFGDRQPVAAPISTNQRPSPTLQNSDRLSVATPISTNQRSSSPAREEVVPEPSQATKRLDAFHKIQQEKLEARMGRRTSALQDSDRQSVAAPISTNQRSSSPAKEFVPEPSQATKRLDAFHKIQQEKLEARIRRRISALRNSDNDSSGDDDAYPDDIRDEGLDYNDIDNVLLRKPSMDQANSFVTANPLDRESTLFDKTVRPNRRAALERHLHTSIFSDEIQHPSKPSQPPQSSEPAFEELRDVDDRILRARNSIVQKARVEPLLRRKAKSIPAETAIQVKAAKRTRITRSTRSKRTISPSNVFDDSEGDHGASAADESATKRTRRTRSTRSTRSKRTIPPSNVFDDDEESRGASTADESTTEEVPVVEPARKNPKFLKTGKKARSKEVVGWVIPAKDMAIMQPRPEQMEFTRPSIPQHQVPPFKSVARADKEIRTGPEPQTAEVAASKPAQLSLPRKKPAVKEGALPRADKETRTGPEPKAAEMSAPKPAQHSLPKGKPAVKEGAVQALEKKGVTVGIIQPGPGQIQFNPQSIPQHPVPPFKSVARTDKETRTGPEPEAAEAAAPKPPQYSLHRGKLAVKEGVVQAPDKEGVTVDIIQPRPGQIEVTRPPISQNQVTPFKPVTRADKETRAEPEPEAAEVAAPKPAQHSLPRRKVAMKEVQGPEKKGATAATIMDTDIGPWSREAFDLFEWRPKELG